MAWSIADEGRVVKCLVGPTPERAFGQTNYSAAKAGMHVGFTKALALEVARSGVTVNLSPGYIGTNMVTAIAQDILDSSYSDARFR